MSPKLAFSSSFLVVLASQALSTLAFAPTQSWTTSSSTTTTVTDVGSTTSLSAVREATFGMGCFWEPSESLLKKPGVLATTVGYTGAPPNKPPPLYDTVCFGKDWVEAVRVAYDDEVVSYTQLLDHFFELQKPGYSRQYASIVFVDDKTEEKEAGNWKKSSIASSSDKNGRDDGLSYEIVEIEPSSSFYKAEEYHQRYWEKKRLQLAFGLALIAGESGAYNDLFGGVLGNVQVLDLSFDGVCGALFFAGAVWLLVERAIARDVREMKQGDLIASVTKN